MRNIWKNEVFNYKQEVTFYHYHQSLIKSITCKRLALICAV